MKIEIMMLKYEMFRYMLIILLRHNFGIVWMWKYCLNACPIYYWLIDRLQLGRSTRLQHLVHWDSIWDWSSAPLTRICSRRFCRTPRSIRPAAHMSPSRYQAPDPHLSAAVAEADFADEDVLAAALVGEGAAAVALELTRSQLTYQWVYQYLYP